MWVFNRDELEWLFLQGMTYEWVIQRSCVVHPLTLRHPSFLQVISRCWPAFFPQSFKFLTWREGHIKTITNLDLHVFVLHTFPCVLYFLISKIPELVWTICLSFRKKLSYKMYNVFYVVQIRIKWKNLLRLRCADNVKYAWNQERCMRYPIYGMLTFYMFHVSRAVNDGWGWG